MKNLLLRSLLPLSALLSLLALGAQNAPAQGNTEWVSAGVMKLPPKRYSFLATTPDGSLLAATFNSTERPATLPVLRVQNPTSASPQVAEVISLPFEGQRGFSGLACLPDGSFFVAGDTGIDSTSFIRKFRSDGSPDLQFGPGGEVRPNRRCLGVDVAGDVLLVALNWGEIGLLRASSGAPMGRVPQIGDSVYIRDIAIDPGTMDIFGVAAGDIIHWTGANPWRPQSYRPTQLVDLDGLVRAGEGISIDPLTRSALSTPIPGNVLVRVPPTGPATRSVISTAQADSWLTDSALSFDGHTLFISDIQKQRIHIMRRAQNLGGSAVVARAAAGEGREEAAAPAPGAYQTRTRWWRSYLGIVEEARVHRKPMLVYFRMGGVPGCEQFQREVLLTPQFDQTTDNGTRVVCVFENVSIDPLIAHRLGVYRVPHVEAFDSNGRSVARFSGEIDADLLLAAVRQLR